MLEKALLELGARKKLYDLVERFAGTHFSELVRKSGMPASTASYHLNYLRKHGLIVEEKEGKTCRYFPCSFTTANKTVMSLLRQDSVRRILLCIITHIPCHHETIVSFTSLSQSTVSWHLKKLEQAGIISAVRKGRKAVYATNLEEVKKMLIAYRQSFLDTLVDRVVEMWEL